LRRSVRQSLKTGGELVDLAFRQRKQKKTKLTVLCDVSGSMDMYSRLLLQFVYGLQNSFGRVETFVFSTHLARITTHLKDNSFTEALARLETNVGGWSGGTLIGGSLRQLRREWGSVIDRRTIVIILSDGWETGEPEELARELAAIENRAGKLIWLNPLLGNPSYRPVARGIRAALPHVDLFAPLYDLASLKALARHLVI
jgi:uncharacterized protein with von Willebrand factor type A (vWA) domain